MQVPVTKPKNLSSVPSTYIVEGRTNSYKLPQLLHLSCNRPPLSSPYLSFVFPILQWILSVCVGGQMCIIFVIKKKHVLGGYGDDLVGKITCSCKH